MEIEIGNKPLNKLSAENLLKIAKIEGVHLFFEYWGDFNLLEFDKKSFSDTYVIDFYQKRISDGLIGKTIVFFFDFGKFSFHWHFENIESQTRTSKRIKIETIKYLIQEGFDIPLY